MAKNPKMVVCRNCNTPISEKAKMCPSCGAKNKKPFYKRGWFVILAIIMVIGVIGSIGGGSKGEKFEWNDIELSSILPEPKSNVGEIIFNSDEHLSIYIHKTSKGDYNDYLGECQSIGFTVESDKSESNYNAYNEAGYKLSLWYNDSDEELHIGLDAPMEMETLQWPTSEIASLLPVPKSAVGTISRESSDGFYIYVGDTSKEDYNAYVNECSEKGFSVDYEKGDTYYRADNADGYHISLSYQGNNVMTVEIEKPEETAPDNTPETDNAMPTAKIIITAGEAGEYGEEFTINKGTEFEETYFVYRLPAGTYEATNIGDYSTQLNIYSDEMRKVDGWGEPAETFFVELVDVAESVSFSIEDGQHIEITEPSKFELEKISDDSSSHQNNTESDELADGMRPEFKEAMDSYEAFYDEYCDFMKEYADNPTDLGLLADYTDMMSKAADMSEKFDAWNEDEMNDAELKYYLEVSNRVTQKLLEVAQ